MAHFNCNPRASLPWALVCLVKEESRIRTRLSTHAFLLALFLLLCLGGASWQARDWAADLEVGFSGLLFVQRQPVLSIHRASSGSVDAGLEEHLFD